MPSLGPFPLLQRQHLCRHQPADAPPIRRRELISAVAHYIAGVLDREPMISIVESLCAAFDLAPGDRVRTLRGSLSGVILRILEDGRVE